jgi:hypothetical protein
LKDGTLDGLIIAQGGAVHFLMSRKQPKTLRAGLSILRSREPASTERRPTCCS